MKVTYGLYGKRNSVWAGEKTDSSVASSIHVGLEECRRELPEGGTQLPHEPQDGSRSPDIFFFGFEGRKSEQGGVSLRQCSVRASSEGYFSVLRFCRRSKVILIINVHRCSPVFGCFDHK